MTEPSSAGGKGITVSTEERIADLERRLQKVEVVPRLRQRSRSMMERVVPPEATHHLRNGARENLTAMRTIFDHWIRRLDESAAHAEPEPQRETIEIR